MSHHADAQDLFGSLVSFSRAQWGEPFDLFRLDVEIRIELVQRGLTTGRFLAQVFFGCGFGWSLIAGHRLTKRYERSARQDQPKDCETLYLSWHLRGKR